MKNYFPQSKDPTAAAKVKPLLLELAGFVARQQHAKSLRAAFTSSKQDLQARIMPKDFKERLERQD